MLLRTWQSSTFGIQDEQIHFCDCSIVIPNVIPAMENSANETLTKSVWRLAFFSRLEERKGLKLFVEAVHRIAMENPTIQDHR